MIPTNTETGTDCFVRSDLELRGAGDSGVELVSGVDMDALTRTLFGGLDHELE